MNKKMVKVMARGLIGIAIVCVGVSISMFVIDTYSVPITNEASLAQVNGNIDDFTAMKTTNKSVGMVRDIVWVLGLLGIITVFAVTANKMGEIHNETEDEKNTKEA
jgi:hypothetical protein